jgi:hypothetical protein
MCKGDGYVVPAEPPVFSDYKRYWGPQYVHPFHNLVDKHVMVEHEKTSNHRSQLAMAVGAGLLLYVVNYSYLFF